MNKYRFEILISALDALPDDIKDSKVGKSTNIRRSRFPELVSIVADDIQELSEIYIKLKKRYADYKHDDELWMLALGNFLGFNFSHWSNKNITFYNREHEYLTNYGIIIQLRGMYRRYVKFIRLNSHIYNAEFLIKESLIKPEDIRWVHAMGCE